MDNIAQRDSKQDQQQKRKRMFDQARLNTLAYIDAAAFVHITPLSKRYYYQAIQEGKLKAYRVGGNGKLVAKREDVDRLFTSTPVESELDALVNEVVSEAADK